VAVLVVGLILEQVGQKLLVQAEALVLSYYPFQPQDTQAQPQAHPQSQPAEQEQF
jgi:hypothetical protein